jgi:organic radical activating enzyme
MEKVTAIDLVKPEPFMVTWDIGRRCNFDCTYCESTRHNTYSPPTVYRELVDTFDFIKTYTELYNRDSVNLNFTGGEPTVNPNFWNLVNHIKNHTNFGVGLTTNGTWDPKRTDFILENMNGVTISWHAEAHEQLRERAIDNAIALHTSGLWATVNVMMHADHWDTAVDAYNRLKAAGVTANPVPLGDGNIGNTNWFKDTEGVLRRTSHEYTKEQISWFWNEKGISKEVGDQILAGNEMGRSCCGNRCLKGKINSWKPVEHVDNHFKDWLCTVNWYFMHIDQHTKDVFHHQTCQATFKQTRGPIGSLKRKDLIFDNVKRYMQSPTPIVCPNMRCGCGMCVPKAKDQIDFDPMWKLVTGNQ